MKILEDIRGQELRLRLDNSMWGLHFGIDQRATTGAAGAGAGAAHLEDLDLDMKVCKAACWGEMNRPSGSEHAEVVASSRQAARAGRDRTRARGNESKERDSRRTRGNCQYTSRRVHPRRG
jgi:hypothetical protein